MTDRSRLTRTVLLSVFAAACVVVVAVGGWLIIEQRAAGSGIASIPPAVLKDLPSPPPSGSPRPKPKPARWLVVMLQKKVPVYDKPRQDARVRMELPARTRFGSETVCLVRKVEKSGGKKWYNVWLPTGPNGARGWIAERGVTTYPVRSQVIIDLSDRQLSVVGEDDAGIASYPIAVGEPAFPTPTGRFFITEKIQPTDVTTAYGAFVMALSAYSPQLMDAPEWQGGQVAIHGTNQPELIGQAVSHGCIRMNDADILKLNTQVKTGSAVIIQR